MHVLHHLGFLIEDLVCIGINLRLLLLIFLQIGLLGIRKRGTSQSQNQEKDGKFSNETHNSSRVRTLFSQLKIDVYQRNGVVSLSVTLGRFKTVLLSGPLRRFIQPVSQASYDPLNPQFA